MDGALGILFERWLQLMGHPEEALEFNQRDFLDWLVRVGNRALA